MTTLYSTSTAWTQTTVWVVGGPVQLPEVTEYSYFQPIEMASYPDPVMSATGTELQSLLKQKHVMTTMTIASSTSQSSDMDVTVIPVTYTTAYLTTTLITIYPTDRLLDSPNVEAQPPSPVVSTSIASTDTSIQTSSQMDNSKIAPMNIVVPITIDTPITSIDPSLIGRHEPHSDVKLPDLERISSHNDPPIISRSASTPQSLAIGISVLTALLLTSLLIHILRKFYNQEDPSGLSYTTKPPRPGLRKRLSLSISMTTGRRSSIASTGSTEATYVSGNAVSTGRAGGKGLGIAIEHLGVGSVGREVRRTPSTPLLEV